MREITATVLENARIAPDVYSLTFACGEEIPVRAGQFCMVQVHGFPLRRPIAVCKAEGERITVCYRVKGAGTHALAETYQKGEKLRVLLPLGNGFFLHGEERVAVVGGGAGVFPLIAAIREFSPTCRVFAYMGFKNRENVCMEYEMRRAEKLVIATDDGSLGYHGTAVQAMMEEVLKFKPELILTCGPLPMLRSLKAAAARLKVPVQASLEERMGCGVGACLVCVCNKTNGEHARVCKDGPVFDLSEVDLDG